MAASLCAFRGCDRTRGRSLGPAQCSFRAVRLKRSSLSQDEHCALEAAAGRKGQVVLSTRWS